MKVRAVIVNYNGGAEVIAGLRSVLASDWPAADLDVVVVDNGSTDGSPAAIEAALPKVRLHRSPGNLGYPAINQVVTDLTGVDAVLIVNPDTVLAPDGIALLAQALDADPGVGAACPRILLEGSYREAVLSLDGPPRASLDLLAVDTDGQWHLTGPRVRRRWQRGVAWSLGDGSVLRSTGSRLTLTVRAHGPGQLVVRSGEHEVTVPVHRGRTSVALDLDGPTRDIVQNAGSVIGPRGVGLNRGYHRPDGPEWDVDVDVPAWCGAAALLRADYLRDVGLLDPRWFLYYEDTDLAWRALRRGWRHRYVAAARVRHAHSTTIGHGSGLYDRQHVRNRLLTVTKNAPVAVVLATWRESLGLVAQQLRGDVLGRLRDRRAPEPVLALRRLRALVSAARATPSVLRDRACVRRRATVADDDLPVLGRWHDPAGGS